MNKHTYIKKNFITIGLILVTILLVYLMIIAYKVVLLIFMSILFALLIDGLASLITKYTKLKKPYSTAASLILILLIAVMLGWLVGPPIIEQVIILSENIPEAVNKLQEYIQNTTWGKQLLSNSQNAEKLLPLGSEAVGYLKRFFSSTFSFVTNALIILILGIYLAFDPKLYTNNLALLFPKKQREKFFKLFNNWGHALKWWLVGRFLSMLVVGILTFIGLWIIGIKLVLSLSIVAAILSFIPFIGPILAFIPAVLLGFAQGPTMALYVVFVYIAVQTLESYLITPLIEQKTVSLPPVLVITAQILMGVLFGFFGVLLASPIFVVIIIAIQILYVNDVLQNDVKLLSDQKKD